MPVPFSIYGIPCLFIQSKPFFRNYTNVWLSCNENASKHCRCALYWKCGRNHENSSSGKYPRSMSVHNVVNKEVWRVFSLNSLYIHTHTHIDFSALLSNQNGKKLTYTVEKKELGL